MIQIYRRIKQEEAYLGVGVIIEEYVRDNVYSLKVKK